MAEIIAHVVAEGVLSKAVQLFSEEGRRFWNFKDDLQKLSVTLEIIHDLMADADGKRIKLKSVTRWLKDLSNVAFDADDMLDKYHYQLLRQQVSGAQKFKLSKVRDLFSSSNPLVVRLVLYRELKQVNSMFDALYKRANDIGLRPVAVLHTSIDLRPVELLHAQIRESRKSDTSVEESKVVGREDDLEAVLRMLEEKVPEELEVIGIVGLGGQGKTTLAQLVYKHEKVESLFDEKMWICVSDDFDVDQLLKEMIQRLDSGHYREFPNRVVMMKEIKKKLIAKKYLLVLEDVRNENSDVWETMKNCLINVSSPMGNKVLVTTRSQDVVSTMQPSRHHSLEGLSDSDSSKQFCKIAFAQGGPEKTQNLNAISERMVKKCGSMPLAIKTLASLMWTLTGENDWLKMEEYINRWSSQGEGNMVLFTATLIYDHLPSLALKRCLAYCSIFKKDTILEKDNLIQLWTAQGFLDPLNKGTHDATISQCDNYFNVLMQNYLFINLEKDKFGDVVSCQMHDIVRDLSVELSKGYCSTLKSEQENGSSQALHLVSDGKLFAQAFAQREFSGG